MRQFMKPERIRIIAVLAIFNYIFLGSEYLFDNMIRYATDSAGVVRAQNYVLGISVIGFLLFPCINRYFKSYRTKCVDENRFQALKIKG